jgi:hypothetical protein
MAKLIKRENLPANIQSLLDRAEDKFDRSAGVLTDEEWAILNNVVQQLKLLRKVINDG